MLDLQKRPSALPCINYCVDVVASGAPFSVHVVLIWAFLSTCRGTEVVEGVLRHHIGACFAALERRVLDLLHEVMPRLKSFEAAKKKPMPGSQQTHPLVEVTSFPLSQLYCKVASAQCFLQKPPLMTSAEFYFDCRHPIL